MSNLNRVVLDYGMSSANPMTNGIHILRLTGHVEIVFANPSTIGNANANANSNNNNTATAVSSQAASSINNVPCVAANGVNNLQSSSLFSVSSTGTNNHLGSSHNNSNLLGSLTPISSPTNNYVGTLPLTSTSAATVNNNNNNCTNDMLISSGNIHADPMDGVEQKMLQIPPQVQ